MKFHVMVWHDPSVAEAASVHLKKCGFTVTNIFESSINVTETLERVLDMYAIECEGGRLAYEIYKRIGKLTEFDVNGIKTLMRVSD